MLASIKTTLAVSIGCTLHLMSFQAAAGTVSFQGYFDVGAQAEVVDVFLTPSADSEFTNFDLIRH